MKPLKKEDEPWPNRLSGLIFPYTLKRCASYRRTPKLPALKSGHLAAAALDVLEQEPTPSDNPLLRLPNVVLSPHAASNSAEGNRRMGMGAVTQTFQVLCNERPPSLVNPEVWDNRRR